MTVKFTDTVSIAGTHKRSDGYLVVDARVARTGVQRYLGSEVGRPEIPFVDVYRPPEEVFATDAMASFAHRPITDDHPTEAVTADNWKELARGQTSDEIRQEDKFLRVPLMVADAETIKKVEGGKKELSAGYTCDLQFTAGTTPDGQTYDAVQTKIRANHIAVVQAGRAGKECRIGDGSEQTWGLSPITTQQKDSEMSDALRNMMVDGLPVVLTDANSVTMTINKLVGDRDKAIADNSTLQAQFDAAMKEKEEELAKKDAAIADAEAKVLDQAGIDKLVADRVALETTAKTLASDLKTAGLSDNDVRKAVVIAKLGDDALKMADGKDDAYQAAFIDARFATLVEAAGKTDQFRDAMNGAKPAAVQDDAIAARQKAFDNLVHFDQTGQDRKEA